jgi:hypothetical protein
MSSCAHRLLNTLSVNQKEKKPSEKAIKKKKKHVFSCQNNLLFL